jgi:hypothetical protein
MLSADWRRRPGGLRTLRIAAAGPLYADAPVKMVTEPSTRLSQPTTRGSAATGTTMTTRSSADSSWMRYTSARGWSRTRSCEIATLAMPYLAPSSSMIRAMVGRSGKRRAGLIVATAATVAVNKRANAASRASLASVRTSPITDSSLTKGVGRARVAPSAKSARCAFCTTTMRKGRLNNQCRGGRLHEAQRVYAHVRRGLRNAGFRPFALSL